VLDQQRSNSGDQGASHYRVWTRFPPEKAEAAVIIGGQSRHAAILDESFGGVGVTLEIDDARTLATGDPLTVVYYGHPTTGHVQWILRQPDAGRARVGVRWSERT